MKNNSLELSLNDTMLLKGVALLLLLAHHLFYQGIGYNDVHLYGSHYLVKEIGIISKFCVAIFVFLSGYGLTVNAEKSLTSLKTFYVHRFVKLMANYWFIWIIFVPIGVFVFNRTFPHKSSAVAKRLSATSFPKMLSPPPMNPSMPHHSRYRNVQ